MGFPTGRKVRILIGVVVGSSGVVGIAVMRKVLKKMLREQKKLAGGGTGDGKYSEEMENLRMDSSSVSHFLESVFR